MKRNKPLKPAGVYARPSPAARDKVAAEFAYPTYRQIRGKS
jgi:hypothetical protein